MVSRTGQDRYRLLDTLRAYALEVLADLDPDATRDRHAAFYAELAERGEIGIRGSEQLAWLESLRSDINNFRTALDWSLATGDLTCAACQAAALSWFWTLNGMLAEAIRPLERLLVAEDIPTAIRAKCHWGYALLAASLGQLTTARTAGYRAVELGRQAGDDAEVAPGGQSDRNGDIGCQRRANAPGATHGVAGSHRHAMRRISPDHGPSVPLTRQMSGVRLTPRPRWSEAMRRRRQAPSTPPVPVPSRVHRAPSLGVGTGPPSIRRRPPRG
jgi:hypothetical protein